VLAAGAVCGTAFVTAFAAMVKVTVPGEHPERMIEYALPEPEGDPIAQVLEPVPDFEKSAVASPVTASLNVKSYVIEVELVKVFRGAKLVIDGPSEVIVTYPSVLIGLKP
jgi:hypothetical protein